MKDALDQLYAGFNHPESALDPVQIVRRYDAVADREVVGFLAAGLAFGRVASVMASAEAACRVLGPSPAEAPDSSLVHMCDRFAAAFGTTEPSERAHLINEAVIDLSTFDAGVAAAIANDEAVLVMGTSFAFVHLLDALGDALGFGHTGRAGGVRVSLRLRHGQYLPPPSPADRGEGRNRRTYRSMVDGGRAGAGRQAAGSGGDL